jgi:hypothetical protein
MSFSVRIEGIDDLLKRLDAAGDTKVLKDGMKSIGVSIATRMKIYPPQPASSSYARTGNLMKRWTSKVEGDGSAVTIGNNAPYAKFVQSAEQQTWFHARTGWSTLEGTVNDRKEQIVAILRAFIQNALNG